MLFRADVLDVVMKKLVKEFPDIFDKNSDISELVEILKKHPKHAKRTLVLRQHRQTSANKSGQRHIQNEEPGE